MQQLPPPDQDDPKEMSLIDHLDELRNRMLKCIAALFIAFILGFFISDPITEFLIRPIRAISREPGHENQLIMHVAKDGTLKLPTGVKPDLKTLATKRYSIVWDDDPAKQAVQFGEPSKQQIYYHNPIDPIMLKIKIGFIVALVITSPLLLVQLWGFIKPGLTDKERRLVRPMLGFGLILFPLGALFAFYMVAMLLRVMQHYQPEGMEPMLEVFKYISLLTTLMLVCGVIFELPLGLAIAARVGLVTPAKLVTYRKHSYLIMGVVSACFAPPDAYSMLMMLAVLIGLYELSILVCKPMAALHQRDRETAAATEAEV